MDLEHIENILKNYGIGRRNNKDNFFEEGNSKMDLFVRQGIKNNEDDNSFLTIEKMIECNVPGCNEKFDSLKLFEMHYNSMHRYICNECKKRLSSPHLLDLHISEEHDSFFAVQALKKPMYRCFVESCQEIFPDDKQRTAHAINSHKFPSDFRFKTNNKTKKKNKKKTNDKTSLEESMEIVTI